MNHLLRKLSTPGRVFAIAAAGSALLSAETITKSECRIIGVSWEIKQSGYLHFGMLPMHCMSVGSVPTPPPPPPEMMRDRDDASGGVPIPIEEGKRRRRTYATAYAKVGPSVVHIIVPSRGRRSSGTIIDKNGTVLTCAHALVDKKKFGDSCKGKVYVNLQDGRRFDGTVVFLDVHSDIAIIKIDSKTPLPSAKLGRSSKVHTGDCVIAVGSPFSLKNTVTAGIVSCAARKYSDMRPDGWREYREYIQTDCSLNPGNSGGPLVNMDGEVIGVNLMTTPSADGLSFAMPIDVVAKVMVQFAKNGRVVRPWLGVKMIELDDVIISRLKKRDSAFPNVKEGIFVLMVNPGSPGERAGFRFGDIVSEFDGKTVRSIKEIIEIMGDRIGEPLKVVVKRVKDEQVTLTVILEESSDPDM